MQILGRLISNIKIKTMRELTQLEKDILELLLKGDDPTLELLRRQCKNAIIIKRENTGVGFFIDFEIPKDIPRTKKNVFEIGDLIADIPGIENEAGFILFIKDGQIKLLEGYTYGEKWPEKIQNYNLKYFGGERDLESLRKKWS